jgi:Xaa-Pro aminopeptidase
LVLDGILRGIMQDKFIYITRRQKLFAKLTSGVAIIPNYDEVVRNQDVRYPYRFDSYFYYLTGFVEPESVLVLDFDNKKNILFCQAKNPKEELWDGIRYGVEASKSEFSFDEVFTINDFNAKILDYLTKTNSLYYTVGHNAKYDQIIINNLNLARKKSRGGLGAPNVIYDINHLVAEMRVIKDSHDIAMLTKTCEISCMAHIEAMKYVKQAKYEYELEAKILEVFYKNGARYPAYQSIVASGGNACILHYVTNNQPLKPGDLVLIDAGSEYMGYAADITRTFPINGKFSTAQQKLYEIVLEASIQAINALQIDRHWNTPSEIARNILIQGLIDLKLLHGSVEDNIASGDYRQFYMHGVGHWLGLDTHDVGSYKINNEWRPFKPGMCTTIEPGLYIAPAANVPEEYWNIGIRIEDDILLTANGAINLTSTVPKEVNDVEHLINY